MNQCVFGCNQDTYNWDLGLPEFGHFRSYLLCTGRNQVTPEMTGPLRRTSSGALVLPTTNLSRS